MVLMQKNQGNQEGKATPNVSVLLNDCQPTIFYSEFLGGLCVRGEW